MNTNGWLAEIGMSDRVGTGIDGQAPPDAQPRNNPGPVDTLTSNIFQLTIDNSAIHR